MVQDQVQLDRPFGPSEMRPVKDAQTQVDGGGIEADQFVFESNFFLSRLASATVQELDEDL